VPLTRSSTATEPIQAGGAVLWRPGSDGPELALVHRPRYDDWSFAKGKQEPGEHIQLTAQREVFEETGQRMVLGRRLPTITYEVAGVPKHVRYWAARVIPSSAGGGRFEPNREVDRMAWLTPGEAKARLGRWLDVTVLEAFLSAPVDTVPIILLRHGGAEHRSAQKFPDDRIRPLTARGRAQAERMALLLDGYGPLDIVSSPATRCLDTVRPFAGSRRTVIDVDPALTESAHEAAPRAAASWIRALIAEGRPTLVSTHRPVLNALLAAVIPPPNSKDGPEGPRINGRPWTKREAERVLNGKLAPGNAWILHITKRLGPRRLPRLVAVDRLQP
jgi:8-oxo-dGTP diphosphatase